MEYNEIIYIYMNSHLDALHRQCDKNLAGLYYCPLLLRRHGGLDIRFSWAKSSMTASTKNSTIARNTCKSH